MAFSGYAAISVMALMALIGIYLGVGIGSWAKRWPALLFIIGIAVTVFGIGLIELVRGFEWAISEVCKKQIVSDCRSSEHYAEVFAKLIEVGFAALGAALVALSIDIKSDIAFESEEADLEHQEEALILSRDQWLGDFELLGQQLETISSKERVERFARLRNRIIALGMSAYELRDRRVALRPWKPSRLLTVPTITKLRTDALGRQKRSRVE